MLAVVAVVLLAAGATGATAEVLALRLQLLIIRLQFLAMRQQLLVLCLALQHQLF